MSTIIELTQKRESKYFELMLIKDEIKEFTQCPCETIPIDSLQNQSQFLIKEINNLDSSIKTILLTQIEWSKRDLANLQTQLDLIPKKFDVTDLPKLHFSMFRN